MNIRKHDIPVLAEFYNSLNSDRLYATLEYLGWAGYVDSLDDNHCVFNKEILNIAARDEIDSKMAKYQWYIAVDAETFIGYRPRFVMLDNTDIFDYPFYHFAPARYEESILKNGLRPKSKNGMETYEPSVYLFSEYLYLSDPDCFNSVDTEIRNLIGQLRHKSGKDELYSVFEIRFKNRKVEIHKDPTYDFGCFIHRLVLPTEIKLIKHC